MLAGLDGIVVAFGDTRSLFSIVLSCHELGWLI